MKTLKITLALVAVLVLTVSGVQSDNAINDNESTFKEYNEMDLLATNKKKAKLETRG